jgi:hypothetical protein
MGLPWEIKLKKRKRGNKRRKRENKYLWEINRGGRRGIAEREGLANLRMKDNPMLALKR